MSHHHEDEKMTQTPLKGQSPEKAETDVIKAEDTSATESENKRCGDSQQRSLLIPACGPAGLTRRTR